MLFDIRSQAALAEDEVLQAEVIQTQLACCRQRMRLWQDGDHALVPQVESSRRSFSDFRHERHIHVALLSERPARVGAGFDDLDRDTFVCPAELLEQVTHHNEWSADGDGQLTVHATLRRSDPLHGPPQMIEAENGFFQESLPRRRWTYACVASLKQLRANAMLQAAHSPAHCGLLNIQCGGRAAKASMFGGRQRVLEQSKVESDVRQ
nr:hypothetical protein [Mesorhizobium sp.]